MENISFKKKVSYNMKYFSLVGQKVEIIDSKIKSQIGLSGIILYESVNFLHLKIENEVKIAKIFKNNAVFKINYEGKPLNIDGRLLFSTVLHRIKKIK